MPENGVDETRSKATDGSLRMDGVDEIRSWIRVLVLGEEIISMSLCFLVNDLPPCFQKHI